MMDKLKSFTAVLWELVKAISILTLVGIVSYKIYVTPMNLTVDFPTLLSLLLALFAVGLAALFYFKATETSNTFYDNTYNFTKDIAQLLVKIESGFGERLRHLDEGYSSMRDYMQQQPKTADEKEAKERIEEEREEIKKVVEERNQMISQLLERSQIHGNEKKEFLEKLHAKEQELEEAQLEISKMKRRVMFERMRARRENEEVEDDQALKEFTRQRILASIDVETWRRPNRFLAREFDRIKSQLPTAYLDDLEQRGYVDSDGDLLPEGARFLRKLAMEK